MSTIPDDVSTGPGVSGGTGVMATDSTQARYACLAERLGEAEGPVTPEMIKVALASRDSPDNPVSRRVEPDQTNVIGYTAGAMVYVLDGQPRMELADGSPCSTDLPFDFAGDSMDEAVE